MWNGFLGLKSYRPIIQIQAKMNPNPELYESVDIRRNILKTLTYIIKQLNGDIDFMLIVWLYLASLYCTIASIVQYNTFEGLLDRSIMVLFVIAFLPRTKHFRRFCC